MVSTVLVVDDDPVHRALLDRIITRLGYGVRVAESGEEALAILSGREAQSIDIVLLDLVMPDLDGMAVLNRLQATGSRIPVVALVSPGGVDGVLGAISAGASDFAVKPVGIERLYCQRRRYFGCAGHGCGFRVHRVSIHCHRRSACQR